jgi:uncharacterized membrane protein YecN with MAPEG domain
MKTITIIRRTKKTVWFIENGITIQRRIETDYNGEEYVIHNGIICTFK